MVMRTKVKSGSGISLKTLPLHSSNSRRLSSTDEIKLQVVPFMSFFLSAKGYEYLYPEDKGKPPLRR